MAIELATALRSASRLTRHCLDDDLIARLARGWKPADHIEPIKKQRDPRPAHSYRGARRNACLRERPKSTWRGVDAAPSPYLPKPSKSYPYNSDQARERQAKQCKRGAHNYAL
jgi:hypothetical protein